MTSRRLLAHALPILALAIAALPGTAAAAGGTFTQVLCTNPDTGASIGLPDGFTYTSTTPSWEAVSTSDCGTIAPSLPGTVPDGSYAAIRYEVTDPALSIDSSVHYGALLGHPGSRGYLLLRQHGGLTPGDLVATSGDDSGIWSGAGAFDHGLAAPLFGSANRHSTTVGGNRRFTIVVACDAAFGDTDCAQQPGDWRYRLFGGKVVLRDSVMPSVTDVNGTLVTAASLRGSAQVTFNATDQGAGVYRWRLYSGTLLVGSGRLSDTDCEDANASNADAYEFTTQHPCPVSASTGSLGAGGALSVSVATLPEGPHPLRLAVEDAAGNESTAFSRTAIIDNVPAPALNGAAPVDPHPVITGSPAPGVALTTDGGWWQSYDQTIAYAWERCTADGACALIPGAVSATYTPTAADSGSRLRSVITATNTANESRTERSALTEPVAAMPASPPEPTPETPSPAPAPEAPSPGAPTAPAPSRPSPSPAESTGSPVIVPGARLKVTIGGAASKRTRFTATTTATGRLTDRSGAPVPNALVTVTAAEARPGARAKAIGHAITRADGTFTYKIGRGPSRSVRFSYDTTAAVVRIVVPARLTLRVGRARTGRITWLTGSLLQSRRAGIKLEIQALDGKRWRTFDTTTTTKGGAYRYGYRFKGTAAGRRFGLRVLVDSPLYPFARAASKPVTVRVTR